MARTISFICVDCGKPAERGFSAYIRATRCCECVRIRKNSRQAERMAAKRANDPAFLEADRQRVRDHMKALRADRIIRRRKPASTNDALRGSPHA